MDPRAEELRSEIRAANQAELAIITAAQTAKRALSTEEKTTADGHAARAVELQGQLDVHLRGEALRLKIGDDKAKAPETQRGQGSDPEIQVRENAPAYEKGDALGSLVFARMRFGNNASEAREWARQTYGESSPQARALQVSTFTAGGAMVGDNFVGAELIELLRAKAMVRVAGARSIPLIGGVATLPKVTGGATSNWGAEGGTITASQQTTGQVKLTEKKLTCLVPVSNDMLKVRNLAVERLIRDDMVASAANAEDLAFLRGSGLAGAPKGMYYWVGDAGRTNSAGTSLANTRTDIRTALNRLGNANAPMIRRAWFIHSRAKNYLAWDMVDLNGNFAYPELRNGSTLADAPVHTDNNIPITLGAGTDTELYYAEMSECFIGDNGELEIEVIANAAYVNSDGTLVSGTSRDESVVRLIRKTDFAMRHVESAHVTEAVAWGA